MKKKDLKPVNEFSLSEEEELQLTQSLLASIDTVSITPPEEASDDWAHITLAMPKSFFPIFKDTLADYQKLLNTQKTFPAFEAMILEAKTSLPNDTNTIES